VTEPSDRSGKSGGDNGGGLEADAEAAATANRAACHRNDGGQFLRHSRPTRASARSHAPLIPCPRIFSSPGALGHTPTRASIYARNAKDHQPVDCKIRARDATRARSGLCVIRRRGQRTLYTPRVSPHAELVTLWQLPRCAFTAREPMCYSRAPDAPRPVSAVSNPSAKTPTVSRSVALSSSGLVSAVPAGAWTLAVFASGTSGAAATVPVIT